jgi:hypothetical protein
MRHEEVVASVLGTVSVVDGLCSHVPSGALIDRIQVMIRTAILLAAFSVSADAQTASSLITRAARAMGGAGALDSLANKTIETNAATFAHGQEETPLSPPRATFATGRGVFDTPALGSRHRRNSDSSAEP